MLFKQLPPPVHLKDHIRYFWTLEADETASGKPFRTIADGTPGLIFQRPDQGTMFQNAKQLPGAFLYGQATTHAEVRVNGRFNAIGVYFSPDALQSVFGIRADELTNDCVDLDLLSGNISSRLGETATAEEQVTVLSDYLTAQLQKHGEKNDADMQYAITRIISTQGAIALKTLREELQITERTFERRFKQYVGMPPKLFARISRFQATVSQLQQQEFDKLSDLAFGNDYADQSHFIRAFREFAGISPFQMQKSAASGDGKIISYP